MATYWRSGEGRKTINTSAHWVVDQSAERGLVIPDYIEDRCSLKDLGVTLENASRTLRPLIPNAHIHYNVHGRSKVKFLTWEAWFSQRLRNRIYFFFHKHGPAGRVVRCIAEWPPEVPLEKGRDRATK